MMSKINIMERKLFKSSKNTAVHFVGIGGIGMSGIAEILLTLGFNVSGSDLSESNNVKKLRKLGANIYIGHESSNVDGKSIVVHTSAVDEKNPEVARAVELGLPIMRRAEMLAELMRLRKGVAVAGTHGKTTTTSFLATTLEESSLNPTYVIGGVVENLKGHARMNDGEFLVAEADESDGSFLLLNPVMSIVTNIDMDHMDFYKTEENLLNSFANFCNKIPFYGVCSLNIHDENIRKIKHLIKRPSVYFGIEDDEAGYVAKNVTYSENGSAYTLYFEGEEQTRISISLPGEHNVLNSLAAISMAHRLGLDFDKIATGISKFRSVGRRLEKLFEKETYEVIDDYAHHPTEISTTLKALRKTRPDNKIVVIFEPHRYSRTADCWQDFFHCFNNADEVLLCPIYPASEKPIDGILSSRLSKDINGLHPGLVFDVESLKSAISKAVDELSEKRTTIVTLGAGTIGRHIREWVSEQN